MVVIERFEATSSRDDAMVKVIKVALVAWVLGLAGYFMYEDHVQHLPVDPGGLLFFGFVLVGLGILWWTLRH